jgi:hypothetical protein
MWLLCSASALVLAGQLAIMGFVVLFLHDARGLSTARAAIVLAVVQVLSAARIYGKLKNVIRIPYPPIGRIHRWSGRLAFVCTLPVAFHCIFILGFRSTDGRVLAHSIVGSFVYGVFAAKVFFVREREAPSWALPLAGGTLFAVLVTLWSTSAYWYFTNVRFGF